MHLLPSNKTNLNLPSNVKFGAVFSGIFFVTFFYLRYKELDGWSNLAICLSGIFAIITLVAPSLLERFNQAWFKLGLILGAIFRPIILGFIFFVLITPMSLVMRLSGRDILLIKKSNVSSYWVDKKPMNPDSFKRQF
jgi:hypothetical protein